MTDTPITKTERERLLQLCRIWTEQHPDSGVGPFMERLITSIDAAEARIAELEKPDPLAEAMAAALKAIKTLEPEPIGGAGLVLGPKALLGQTKRIAHRALAAYQEKKNERRKP